ELAGPAEKLALGDFSVHVMVVKFGQLGCEIFGCQSRHGVSFLLAGANEPVCFDYEAIAMDDPGFFQWGQTPCGVCPLPLLKIKRQPTYTCQASRRHRSARR